MNKIEKSLFVVLLLIGLAGLVSGAVAAAEKRPEPCESCECRELKRIRFLLEWMAPPGIPGDGNPGGGGELP